MSLKAKLSPTKFINFWNYIVIENVERKNPEITYVPQQDCVSGFPFRFPTVFPT